MNRHNGRTWRSVAIGASAGALLLIPGVALAQGPPEVNQTDHAVNETEVFLDVHPCTSQPAELTLTESGVIHFSSFANGTVHFTGTLHGTFSLDTLPTDGIPDATGSFVTSFGGNGLLLEEGGAVGRAVGGSTLNGRGTNADGTIFKFHAQTHTVFDSAGVPRLDFSNDRCV